MVIVSAAEAIKNLMPRHADTILANVITFDKDKSEFEAGLEEYYKVRRWHGHSIVILLVVKSISTPYTQCVLQLRSCRPEYADNGVE